MSRLHDPTNPRIVRWARSSRQPWFIWAGTIGALLVYVAIIFSMGRAALFGKRSSCFSVIHHRWSCSELACSAALLWLIPLESTAPTDDSGVASSKGVIVGSATNRISQQSGGATVRPVFTKRSLNTVTSRRAEYHNTIGESGGSRASADAEVTHYPVGMELEVYYDPQDPTHSSLHKRGEMVLTGASLVVVAGFMTIAIYAAFH